MRLITALTALLVVAGCATPPTPQEMRSATYGPASKDHQEIVASWLMTHLKDPASAQVQWGKGPAKAWTDTQDGRLFGYGVCLSVNAKNDLGGYIGFNPWHFLIRNGQIVAVIGGQEWGRVAEERCRKNWVTASR